MTSLVACLSTGKGTWGHVAKLISDNQWDKIYIITNEFGKEQAKFDKPVELIIIDPDNQPLTDLIESIKNSLKGKLTDFEVAVNFISGSGKEHMALLSALLKLGIAVRMVALTKDGMKEI